MRFAAFVTLLFGIWITDFDEVTRWQEVVLLSAAFVCLTVVTVWARWDK